MHIPTQTVHDLKTERADVLPPLPQSMRLVPVFFYAGALGAVAFAVITFLQIRGTAAELDAARRRTTEAQKELDATVAERGKLEHRAKRGADYGRWVEGAVNIQPLVVAITRSVGSRVGITELALSRDDKSGRQIQLALKMQPADVEQLEKSVQAIRDSSFRPFSAEQSQEDNHIEYQATLIWQPAAVAAETVKP